MPAFLSHAPARDESHGADLLVVPVASTEGLVPALDRIGPGIAGAVSRAIDLGDFDPAKGEQLLVHASGPERYPRILLAGLTGEAGPAEIRRALTAVALVASERRCDRVAVLFGPDLGSGPALVQNAASVVDGLLQGSYRWTGATGDDRHVPGHFVLLADTAAARTRLDEGIRLGRAVGEAVLIARDLANEPANRMSPADLAERARSVAKGAGLRVKVLAGAQLEKENMEAMLTVGAGSARDPRLIVLEYEPKRKTSVRPLALVGKGLVFDTGGLNIKPGASMAEMKFDKCGGCVVIGAMAAIAALEPPVPVVGVVPAVENSISGDSYRPGDVIGSRSGKTIEVLNTDAEGRVVLADALDYVITTYDPQGVVDTATLTGAVVVALGDHACGVVGNDDEMVERLELAGERVGEPAWPLPLWDEYRDDVKTPNADVRNTSAHGAGTIAGAAFLEHFVREVPWAHLDIAGVSRDRREPKNGATGFGVRLLVETVRAWKGLPR